VVGLFPLADSCVCVAPQSALAWCWSTLAGYRLAPAAPCMPRSGGYPWCARYPWVIRPCVGSSRDYGQDHLAAVALASPLDPSVEQRLWMYAAADTPRSPGPVALMATSPCLACPRLSMPVSPTRYGRSIQVCHTKPSRLITWAHALALSTDRSCSGALSMAMLMVNHSCSPP
jgi:hypothetical protein